MKAFSAIDKTARPALLRDYRAYLQARDGIVDATARTLSKREAGIQRFLVGDAIRGDGRDGGDGGGGRGAGRGDGRGDGGDAGRGDGRGDGSDAFGGDAPGAIRGDGRIDRALFELQYRRFDPRRATPPEMLLLLALVKVNAAEAYGVQRTIDGALARAGRCADDTELVLLVEESYHTRILLSAARLYGLDVPAPARPHAALRALVSSIARLPGSLARPLTLAGEMMGVLVFLALLDAARVVLKDAPAVRDAIEERLIEILIDEIGHVSFQRLSMGRAGLALTRALLPIVARGLARAVPEVAALGAFPRAPVHGITALFDHGLPEAVRRHAFLA
jgi:hypothetical protein